VAGGGGAGCWAAASGNGRHRVRSTRYHRTGRPAPGHRRDGPARAPSGLAGTRRVSRPAATAHRPGRRDDLGMTLRVALVDDQALVRSGFAMVLSVEDDIEVVGQAADGAEAVQLITRERPDVVLMDVQIPVLDGIEASRRV